MHVTTPLRHRYLRHLFGLVVLFALALGVHQLWATVLPTRPWLELLQTEPAAEAIGIALCGEAIFLVVASIITCWAGRDEPIVSSQASAAFPVAILFHG